MLFVLVAALRQTACSAVYNHVSLTVGGLQATANTVTVRRVNSLFLQMIQTEKMSNDSEEESKFKTKTKEKEKADALRGK